jgi:broad specificity phosphatase PhoE
MTILLVRHASTGAKRPEGLSQIPLNAAGRAQAAETTNWIQGHRDQLPKIDRVVSSDLNRATETAYAIAGGLGLDRIEARRALRAYAPHESIAAYRRRTDTALAQLQAEPGTLAVIHRSTISHAANRLGLVSPFDPNKSLIDTGGVLFWDGDKLEPLYRSIPSAWKGHAGEVVELADTTPPAVRREVDDDTRNWGSSPVSNSRHTGPLEHRAKANPPPRGGSPATRKDLTFHERELVLRRHLVEPDGRLIEVRSGLPDRTAASGCPNSARYIWH